MAKGPLLTFDPARAAEIVPLYVGMSPLAYRQRYTIPASSVTTI